MGEDRRGFNRRLGAKLRRGGAGGADPAADQVEETAEDGRRGERATYTAEAEAVERTVEAQRKREKADRYKRLLEEKKRMIERKEAGKSGKIPVAEEPNAPKAKMSARRRYRTEQKAAETEL